MAKKKTLATAWADLATKLHAAGLDHRVTTAPVTAKAYSGTRATDPKPAQLAKWLPKPYTEFVAEAGYPAIDLGRGLRWAMLPPPAMCNVTGAMGHPNQDFDLTRTQRKAGTYVWPFAFFCGYDLSDVNGWCFYADEEEPEVCVWVVEDSLPLEPAATFEDWLRGEMSSITTAIASAKKVDALLAQLREDEGLEDDEALPKLSFASFT